MWDWIPEFANPERLWTLLLLPVLIIAYLILLRLKGRVALVTGAGSGIGRAIAVRLAKMGMNIALCGRREENLWATADATGRPEDMLIIAGDLTDESWINKVSEPNPAYILKEKGAVLNAELNKIAIK